MAGRRGRRSGPVLVAAASALVAAGMLTTTSGLLVGPLHAEFGWSHGAIAAAVSVHTALYGLTAPFAAALMERFGVRRVVAAALLLIAAGALLSTAVRTAWQFGVCWGVLVGLGTGSLAMAFAATVADRWFPQRRGLVVGVLTAAGVFGQFAFLPVLAQVAEAFRWRAVLVAVAAVAVCVVPVAWTWLRGEPRAAGEHDLARALRVLRRSVRSGPFWVLAGMFAICGASTNGVLWSHFVPAAHQHGMPVAVASSLLAVIGVCNLAGTVAAGWLTDRVPARWLLAGLFAARAGALLCLPGLLEAAARPPLVGFAVVFGVLDVATVPPVLALAHRHFGPDAAVVSGWIGAAHQLGAGLMAFTGGTLRDLLGSYGPMWMVAGALCLVAASMSLRMRPSAAVVRRTACLR